MDDIVKQAMAKWPNVPACYGWLGLDGRGDWYMRDAHAQAAGEFSSKQPGAKGSRLEHQQLIAFIGRNYAKDPQGCWYFQNGPQRVFVELEIAPWIFRLDAGTNQLIVLTHTGFDAGKIEACLLDEYGRVYLNTQLGLGLVHTQDMWLFASALEKGWCAEPEEVQALHLPSAFGYVLSPGKQMA